jgi:hypothetical protein
MPALPLPLSRHWPVPSRATAAPRRSDETYTQHSHDSSLALGSRSPRSMSLMADPEFSERPIAAAATL